ncbi:MAG: DUF296 domain-containing protein [Myxococcales bacterium]|nr:DUF296 domain-containing protein [Myxococcales bacterium]
MIFYESTRGRRLVGRLERGDDPIEALSRLAVEQGIQSAWVRGIGAFESVRVCEYDQADRRYSESVHIEAPTEILCLEGNVSIKQGVPFAHLHVTLSRETASGIQVLGGHLLAGKVFAAELMIECFDDLSLRREADPATGLQLWTGEGSLARSGSELARSGSTAQDPAPPPGLPAGVPSAWAAAAAASAAAEEAPLGGARPALASLSATDRIGRAQPAQEELSPGRGDWIDHQQFGLCKVERVDGEGALFIKLPSARRKRIRIDFMEVGSPRQDGARRIFPLRPKKRA